MSTIDNLRQWWQSRELREQRMLAMMFVAVAAFALWFGVVAPLQHMRDAARDRRDSAAADLQEVTQAVDAITALQARNPGLPTGDAFTSAILDTAASTQVPVSRQRTGDAGMLEIGIDAVAAPALLGWLDALIQQHGIAPQALDISERNGSLQVQASFRAPPP
ncbi:type II secretion system protein GspM [Lysobacter sp. F6437]|uniref:type II secretion system protein GspM n=1 Tax=Lysobacter sp. F6437 TaxID=3459296 RepID=UPI00403D6D51